MKAVVMAGGEGTRLRPLTCNLPKPMVPIMDKPVMEYAIRLLREIGITEIAVTLQYLPERVKSYFGDGSEWGVELHYYVEESPLGTAGSVKNAQDFLDETFIVVSGDALTDFDLKKAIDFHQTKQALATLVLTRVESPLEYGLVLTEPSGAVTRFLEKPSWGEVFSDTVNTGIYVLEPEVFEYIPSNTVFDFSKDVFPRLLRDRQGLFGCVLDGYWCDIGACESYRQVHLDILDEKVNIQIECERLGSAWVGAGVSLSSEAVIQGPVYIGPGSEVRAGASLGPYAVLGEGCLVERGASVKRTVTGKGCYIGPGAQVRGAVLGRGVTVQSKAGIFEDAVIGDHSTVGAEATVKPGIKIWPHKHIEEGRSVLESVVWSQRVTRSLFARSGIKGEINHELTPENTARIGRALGTYLPVSTRVVVGTDSSPASQVLKDALVSGLLATGLQVIDVGRCLLPAFRYAAANLDTKCGIYARVLAGEQRKANLVVIDGNGADLPKREERKVENIWSREEFRQVPVERIMEKTVVPGIASWYISALLDRVDIDRIKRRRYAVMLAAEHQYLSDSMAELLDRLGCRVYRIDPRARVVGRDTSSFEIGAALEEIRRIACEQGFGIGLYLYDSGQKLALVDKLGRIVKEETYLAFLAYLFGHRFQTVYIPVHLPRAVESSLRSAGQNVVRTKSSPDSLMEEMLKGGENDQFHLYADGLYATLRILEHLACRDKELEEEIEVLPVLNYHRRETRVAWEHKGRVIRRLAEERGVGLGQEPLEGVHLENSEGWTLVLPDEERPVCRIYSEAFSQEAAEALTDFYEQRIREICSENAATDAHRCSKPLMDTDIHR